jgi:hypothetical protein
VPKLSRFELDQLREALDQLKLDNSSEPIVLIMWVVAGSNEPSYDSCLHWKAAEMEGDICSFTRVDDESVADFQSRVGDELEAISRQIGRESGFYRYSLRPITDEFKGS